jgi:hypothetical protein
MRIRVRPRKPKLRKDVRPDLHSESTPVDTNANLTERVWLAAEKLPPPAIALNLLCLCGHTRRDHYGLRMEISGKCLECGCQGFAPGGGAAESDEQVRKRVRAALERARHLEEVIARLPARNGS